jgi:hypothetical protein
LYTPDDGRAVEAGVELAYRVERPLEYPVTTFGRYATSRFGFNLPLLPIKPDILNFYGKLQGRDGLFNEIKPLSANGVSEGISQMTEYFLTLMPFGFLPDVTWHNPTTPLILPNISIGGKNKAVIVFNIGGILFYTDDSSREMKQRIAQLSRSSFESAIQGVKGLLYIPSDSDINDLAKGKHLIQSSQNTADAVNTALLLTILASTLALSRGFV